MFGVLGPKYRDAGYSTIPIEPGTKAFRVSGWAEACEDHPSDQLFDQWCKDYADWGIGLCCGPASNVIAVDYDIVGFNDLEDRLIGQILPQSEYVKFGKKGWTRFYRFNPAIISQNFALIPSMKMEILSTGRQTVLPPTIHCETKKPYVWTHGEELLFCDLNDLPIITSQQIQAAADLIHSFSKKINQNFDKNTKGGRHDFLLNMAFRLLSNNDDLSEISEYLLKLDEKMHENPWFTDSSEPHSRKHPKEAAYSFVQGCLKTIKSKQNARGEILEAQTPEFPTKVNGFFFKIPNKKNPGDFFEKPDVHGLAEYLKWIGNLTYLKQNDSFYRYENGLYSRIGTIDVQVAIIELTHKKVTSQSVMANFLMAIRTTVVRDVDDDTKYSHLLNLKNGVLDLSTMVLLPHSREYFFTDQLPYDYDPLKKWDDNWPWLQWLRGIFPVDAVAAIAFIQAMLGYVIMGGEPFLHKAFAFVGDGGNGKSVLLGVIQKLIGKQAYAAVPIQDLDKEFKAMMLVGKKINMLEEADPKILDASNFKKAVAGETLMAADKYKPIFTFKCQARFIMNCNRLPVFRENNAAIQRRLCFLNFNRFFSDDVAAEFDSLKFVQSLDASMLLNWCIEGMHYIRANRKLPFNPFHEATNDEMQRQSDGVYAFLMECVKFDAARVSWGGVRGIYNSYRTFCEKSGYRSKNVNNFSREFRTMLLRTKPFGEQCVRRNSDSKQWQFRLFCIESIE